MEEVVTFLKWNIKVDPNDRKLNTFRDYFSFPREGRVNFSCPVPHRWTKLRGVIRGRLGHLFNLKYFCLLINDHFTPRITPWCERCLRNRVIVGIIFHFLSFVVFLVENQFFGLSEIDELCKFYLSCCCSSGKFSIYFLNEILAKKCHI